MAKSVTKSPLTSQHYSDLKRIQKSIAETMDYLKKCKNCRLDVEQEIKASEDQLAVVNGLLREFFPDQP